MAGKSVWNWTRENKFSSLLSVGEGLWNAGWREMFFWAHVIWLIDKRVISNIKKAPEIRSKLFRWAFSLDSISFLKRRATIATRFPRLVYRLRRGNLQEHSKATPLLTFRVSFQFFHRQMYVREQKGSQTRFFLGERFEYSWNCPSSATCENAQKNPENVNWLETWWCLKFDCGQQCRELGYLRKWCKSLGLLLVPK